MWDIIWCCVISPEINSLGCTLVYPLSRENILVLDIFFEALNYEKIEQKKAYEIAGLLGKILAVCRFIVTEKLWFNSVSALSALPRCTFHMACSRLVLWGFLFELVKQAEHIFIIWCSCKGTRVGSDEKLELDGHFWQFCSDYSAWCWVGSDSVGNCFTRHCSVTVPAHIC